MTDIEQDNNFIFSYADNKSIAKVAWSIYQDTLFTSGSDMALRQATQYIKEANDEN